ncbi:ethanolamine ammonia-lyase small subunit [Lentisphaera araneosa HTCC2155]|uniref:Ethanolamine ammonia-lyase small subunit n=1 Tax=Lentisphaera araneosa HTCC2155 TaxID=313628 RepID=A6DI03_9BACT|nr:ethanolamine ammonia-lyase subunit EutC [Lentisphaera araneosa]EDM28657.1 ethanolamine ammonia-lyase small subunit [Lentisphaera araneosa HTCC2155]
MKNEVESNKALQALKALSAARLGLQRAGSSISTRDILKFDLDHARARDAVHLAFDIAKMKTQLKDLGLELLELQSAASDRSTYLQRPDLGRKLAERSVEDLKNFQSTKSQTYDLGIFIADGLSSRAIHTNALPFLRDFLPLAENNNWTCAPLTIVNQGRVAIADEIGEILKTRLSIILIGERPGLSAADSMGIYITYEPRVGRNDSERNCLSNIRQGGLSSLLAAEKLEKLIQNIFCMGVSGVDVKEGADTLIDHKTKLND